MRKLFTAALFFLCVNLVHAQKAKAYMSGLKAGVNLSGLDVSNDFEGSADRRTSFHAGIFFKVPFGSMFSVQPEFLFSGEGADFKSNANKTETMLNYLSIPVMFQFNTTGGFLIETGPALNVLVKGRETITTTAATSELDLKKQIKKTNLLWAGGIGYQMKKIGFDARYYFGLSNLAKTTSRPDTKSSLIQVGLSWSFQQ